MSAPRSPPGGSRPTSGWWRLGAARRFFGSLVARTAVAVGIVCALILGVLGIATYFVVRAQTVAAEKANAQAIARIAATRIESRLARIARSAEALARNPVVRNALLDNSGRATYVSGFLEAMAEMDGQPISVSLHDLQGDALVQAGSAQPKGPAIANWVRSRIDAGEPGAVFVGDGSYVQEIGVFYPTVLPSAGSVERGLMVRVPSEVLLAGLGAGTGHRLVRGGAAEAAPGAAHLRLPLQLAPPFSEPGISLLAAIDDSGGEQALVDLRTDYIALASVCLALTVMLSIAAARAVTKPIRQLASVTQEIARTGKHEASQTIPLASSGEVGILARSFEQMLERLRDAAEAERKLAESAQEQSHQRLHLALRAARAGAWSWDRATNRAAWSDENYALMGLAPGACEACYENWLAQVHPEDRAAAEAAVVQAMERRSDLNAEFRVVWPDGSIHWINDVGRMILDAIGEPAGMYGIQIDITERKLAEETLRTLNATLEARVQEELARNREKDHLLIQQARLAAMGEMIGNIAHQWRQPLNSLALLLANLQDAHNYGELDAAYLTSQIDHGSRVIQRMSMTIDDFRRFLLPNRENQRFRVSAAVREAMSIVQSTFNHHRIGIEVQVREDAIVFGFANEYTQVLLNLLGNAKDAIEARGAEDGWIRITVDRCGPDARLSVSDNGGGIPDDVMPKIFDPYFTTRRSGTGIGLYMSKMIITSNMAGRIEARNTREGAELIVSTPALATLPPSGCDGALQGDRPRNSATDPV